MDIEITLDDVKLIMGNRFERGFGIVTHSIYCTNCQNGYKGTMQIKKIWLNHLGDVVLDGSCDTCGHRVQRYMETGEDPESYEQAMAIRELKIEVLKDYKRRS